MAVTGKVQRIRSVLLIAISLFSRLALDMVPVTVTVHFSCYL